MNRSSNSFLRRRVTVLGSTGSIGVNTLDVIRAHPDRFEVVALTAGRQVERLAQQCLEFKPRIAVVADAADDPPRTRGIAYCCSGVGLRYRDGSNCRRGWLSTYLGCGTSR